MSCKAVARLVCLVLTTFQVGTATLLAKKHHHHQHVEQKISKDSDEGIPDKLDEVLAANNDESPAEKALAGWTGDEDDPNGWGAMSREELDREFPMDDGEGGHFGIYDLRSHHFAIEDTPEKMDPDWQAQQRLKAVNALSGRHVAAMNDDDDDTDDD